MATAFPMLDGPIVADVCVVGLGGSGLAAIGDLIARGLSVVGIDRGQVAAGAAGRNGGFLLGGPAPAVHRAAQLWGTDVAVDLYRRTLHEIGRLRELLGSEVIQQTGSIRLAGLPGEPADVDQARDRDAELADCDEQFVFLTAHGIDVERYDGTLGEGLFMPDDAAMNPVRRALGLAELYRDRSRLFENSTVMDIKPGLVTTTGGSVSCDAIVVAVDGGLDVLFPGLADRVRTGRLQMLATDPLGTKRLPCPVYCRWGYDYARQDPSGRLFVGGGRDKFIGAEWTRHAEPSTPVQRWIESIAVRFAGGPVTVRSRWAASVAYTEDGRALVTEVLPGVAACGGYCGTGNLVGPIAARAAVALLLDKQPPEQYFGT
jgi:gamma-glutamylputrescine oxidase